MRERTRFERPFVSQLFHLRLLVTTGSRNAAIDLGACAEHGVVVSGTRGVAHGAAELTWALILAASRHLEEEASNVRAGRWMTTVGRDLRGSRLGVIGLGRQGRQVARVALAFGTDVVAWSEHLQTGALCRGRRAAGH